MEQPKDLTGLPCAKIGCGGCFYPYYLEVLQESGWMCDKCGCGRGVKLPNGVVDYIKWCRLNFYAFQKEQGVKMTG